MASVTAEDPQIVDEAPILPETWRFDFEGPIPASRWPTPYERWFRLIRGIGRVYFAEYTSSNTNQCNCGLDNQVADAATLRPDDQIIADKRRQVHELNKLASRCRRERQNEAGWRDAVESTVFGRFGAEVIWYVADCRID